jgi:hypothetical protein
MKMERASEFNDSEICLLDLINSTNRAYTYNLENVASKIYLTTVNKLDTVSLVATKEC